MTRHTRFYLILVASWLAIAVTARVIPHVANLSPFAALVMVMGCQLSRKASITIAMLALLLSDMLLSMTMGYTVFGNWSLFTYSGFGMIALSSHYLQTHRKFGQVLLYGATMVVGYWLWTNFGTWLMSALYPHTYAGLVACYTAAIPFLQRSAISALIFVPIFLGMIRFVDYRLKGILDA